MNTRPIFREMDEPAYFLDIEGLRDGDELEGWTSKLHGRPWVGIRFECCGAYARIYRNLDGTAYRGCCPRCGAPVTLRVGPGGTNARFFLAE